MEIKTYVNHRGLDLVVTITRVGYTPAEAMTRHHPGCPAEIEILDGFCVLDVGKPTVATQQVQDQINNNKFYFWTVVDTHEEEIVQQLEEEGEKIMADN